MVTHHLLDSLSIVPHLDREDAVLRIADIGTGPGLPGIPLALARPAWQVTLNDRSSKKTAFLRQATIELALTNVAVHEGQVQRWQPRERFNCVVSRAFAALEDFVATCRHLVSPGGLLAAMKGVHPAGGCDALPNDIDCSDVRRLRVPLLDAERHLVLCRVAGAPA
jgi:16S rRNA (guanine527-N7)-methyltransferase